MADEALRQQVDVFLDDAAVALEREAWPAVKTLAEAVLALEPENGEARRLLRLATRRLDRRSTASMADEHSIAEAERRQITVMFCDLAGSTALSERLDPEELRDLVRRYQEACVEQIGRFGGSVAQYLGDGLVVYFGYPGAHEDDAQRAVRAALGILSAIGPAGLGISVRVGIHTGLVVVGEMGAGDRQERLALGETPNLAARLQELAAPDTVVISGATRALVEGYFEHEPLGELTLKGLSRPVAAFRVVGESGAASRQEAAPARIWPLVGRDEERAVLAAVWDRARAGEPHVVVLTGEAGIGKTRLVQDLVDSMDGASHTWCQCSPFRTMSPLYPVVRALEREWALGAAPDNDAKVLRVQGALQLAGVETQWAVSSLAALLALAPSARYSLPPLAPGIARQQTLDVVVAWLVGSARSSPRLLVVEDLHWADPSTLELVEMVVKGLSDTGLLAIFTTRPETLPPWRDHPGVTVVNLASLSPAASAELAGAVAAATGLPPEARDVIVARSDGVPLFIEELTREMLEAEDAARRGGRSVTRASASGIPTTLEGLLTSRLDRLGPAKEVAQVAATIGRTFMLPLLEAVSAMDTAALRTELNRLVRAELLEAVESPASGEYRFRHMLIRDAAYQSQLRSRRREIHERVARALERRFPDIAASQPEIVARHLTEAGLGAQAMPYWVRAGSWARQQAAYPEAVQRLRAGLELLPSLPEGSPRDQIELELLISLGISQAATRGFAAPEVGRIHQRARELCRSVDAGPLLFAALGGLYQFYYYRGEFAVARDLAEQHRAAVLAAGELNRLCASYAALGYTSYQLGDLVPAREQFAEALTLYRTYPRPWGTTLNPLDLGVAAQVGLAVALCPLGHLDQALSHSREAIDLGEALRREMGAFSLATAHAYAARNRLFRREPELAASHARRAIELGMEHGYPVAVATGHLDLAAAHVALGEHALGARGLSHALAKWRADGFELDRPYWLGALAEAQAAQGELDEALVTIESAIGHAREHGSLLYDAEIHRLRGALAFRRWPDEPERAADDFGHALSVARQQEARLFELRAAVSLHRLRLSQGRGGESRPALEAAFSSCQEGLDTPDLLEARALLAGC